jgi:hypothetical protein
VLLAKRKQLASSSSSSASPSSQLFADFEQLRSNLSLHREERRVTYAQMAVLARDLAGEEAAEPREICEWLARFHCNNVSVADAELKEIGIGKHHLFVCFYLRF